MNTILRYKLILLLLTGVFAFAACNKEEQDPFAGKDSYITAFSLKQGETVFTAAIAGNEITITAPEYFSLAQAKASVKLSENAAIYPDPATITDWDDDQIFAVTAYNGTQAEYKYTVKRSGNAYNGTIILETQAEVDAFGAQDITFINGNLTIGRTAGTDSVTSLAPLAKLKEVVYAFTLQPTCAFTGLEGLENLERIGGILQIGGTTSTTALKHLETLALPALKQAGNISIISTVTPFFVELSELTRVEQRLNLNCPHYQLHIPNLQYAGSLTLTAQNNASTSLAAISLPMLEEVGDFMTISNLKSVDAIHLPKLKKTGSVSFTSLTVLSFVDAPQWEEAAGTVTLSSLSGLPEFILPKLKHTAALSITGCAGLRTLEFPELTGVDNSISINGSPVNGFAGFPALQTVGGTVTLTNANGAGKLEIPASLQTVSVLTVNIITSPPPSEINIKGKSIGRLEIKGNAIQTKLVGDKVFHGILHIMPGTSTYDFPVLDGFEEVDSLYISGGACSSLNIAGIRKIKGGMYVTNTASTLLDFSMPDMEETGGNTTINFSNMTNAVIETVSLDKLKSVGGNFILTVNTKSAKTLTCPELTTVNGNFTLSAGYDYSTGTPPGDVIVYNRGFESLLFPKLTAINGKLTVNSSGSRTNTKLTALNGLTALTDVKAIEITRMAALTDYSGLKNAFPLPEPVSWTVTNNSYNPTYQNLLDGKWTK
jgi:hypothetical protein